MQNGERRNSIYTRRFDSVSEGRLDSPTFSRELRDVRDAISPTLEPSPFLHPLKSKRDSPALNHLRQRLINSSKGRKYESPDIADEMLSEPDATHEEEISVW